MSVQFVAARTSLCASRIMQGFRIVEILFVENPSNAVICRRKLRDGIYHELLFVIFFCFRDFEGIFADKVREFKYFSGSVLHSDVKVV